MYMNYVHIIWQAVPYSIACFCIRKSQSTLMVCVWDSKNNTRVYKHTLTHTTQSRQTHFLLKSMLLWRYETDVVHKCACSHTHTHTHTRQRTRTRARVRHTCTCTRTHTCTCTHTHTAKGYLLAVRNAGIVIFCFEMHGGAVGKNCHVLLVAFKGLGIPRDRLHICAHIRICLRHAYTHTHVGENCQNLLVSFNGLDIPRDGLHCVCVYIHAYIYDTRTHTNIPTYKNTHTYILYICKYKRTRHTQIYRHT